jgi:hypothetical protein
MNISFSRVIKNKIFLLIFVFLTFFAFAVPQVTHAGFFDWLFSNNCGDASTATTPEARAAAMACLRGENAKLQKIDEALGTVENGIKTLGDVVAAPFAAFALGAGMLLITVFSSVAALSSSILSWVIGATQNAGCYTCMDNAVIATGWPRVRDLANMFIVLGFVFIGIATTLRIGDYEAKKLLPKLIMVALLINFSLVICGIFIDAANITATYFLKSGGFFATSWSQTIGDQISVIWGQWKSNSSYVDAGMGVLKVVGGLLFYDIMAAVIFFLYAFLYIFRMMSLWILVILSPLAFVCYVFPFTKSIFNMWWSNFFQWCIIIVPVSFFVWIADKLTEGMSSAGKASPMAYLVPGTFMLLGFLFSIRIAPMGAGAAIGMAKGTVGFVSGAVPGATAMGMRGLNAITGGRTGAAAEKTRQNFGRAMERVGLRPMGGADAVAQDKIKKESEGYSTAFAAAKTRNDKAEMDRIKNIAKTRRGSQGAAAMIALKNNDALLDTFKDKDGKVNYQQLNQRIDYAESVGARGKEGKGFREDIAKSNPMLAGEGKVKETVQKLAPAEFAKSVSHEAMSSPEVIANMTKDQISYLIDPKNKNKVDPRKIKAIREAATPRTAGSASMKSYLAGVQKSDPIHAQAFKNIAQIQKGARVKVGNKTKIVGRIKPESQLQKEELDRAIDADALEETVARQMKEDDLAEKEKQIYELRKKEGRLTPEEKNKETDEAYDEYMAKRKAEEERIAQQFKQIDQNKKT